MGLYSGKKCSLKVKNLLSYENKSKLTQVGTLYTKIFQKLHENFENFLGHNFEKI